MKIVITGGAGFIGSHIADRLIEERNKVVIIDNLVTGKRENINPEAKFYEIDIINPTVIDIIVSEEPEVILHLAAQVKVDKSLKDVSYDANSNIIGTINILEGAQKAKVRKVIYISTAAVYGNPEYLPVDEKHPVNPISFYGLSKYIAENYISLYSQIYGINYTILRLSNVYGPRQVI